MQESTMTLSDLLACKSLRYARVIIPPKDLNVQVTGINIIEAPDIEKWAKRGMVLLTSYFALQDLDHAELNEFFLKIQSLGISCLIVKINRLIKEIPRVFIDLCGALNIPLLEIPETKKYEEIMVEVLSFILSRREQRLALYYRLSEISSRMAIDMLGMQGILSEFNKMLLFDLSLQSSADEFNVNTNPTLANFEYLGELPMEHWEYMTLEYKRYRCSYPKNQDMSESSIVYIELPPTAGNRNALIIHEGPNRRLDLNDVIIIENLIRTVQLELLREYSLKQQKLLNKNALVGDILRGVISSQAELTTIYQQLELEPDEEVRVMIIDYYPDGDRENLDLPDLRSKIRTSIQRLQARTVYFIASSYDQFIMPRLASGLNKNASTFQALVQQHIHEYPGNIRLRFYGGISNYHKLSDLSLADYQSKSISRFLTNNYPNNYIEEFDNLGIFKLFIGEDDIKLNDHIHPGVKSLYEHYHELYDTLCVYLNTGTSFARTADELFLHPKTVKYRIEKIKTLLNLNLENIHDLSILLTSIEILNFQAGVTTYNE